MDSTYIDKGLIEELSKIPAFLKFDKSKLQKIRSHVHGLLSFKLTNSLDDDICKLLPGLLNPRCKDVPKFIKYSDNFMDRLVSMLESSSRHCHKGETCGKSFLPGENIYRCVQCSFDDTCVLCSDCFNEEDHVGHLIMASVAGPHNTGTCDCGDPEAWNRKLTCKADTESSIADDTKNENLVAKLDSLVDNSDFTKQLRTLITTCLTYCTGTLGQSVDSLGFYVKRVDLFDRFEFLEMMDAKSCVSWINENYNIKVSKSQNYFFVIWNDEDHPFDYAINAISLVNQSRKSKQLAELIDKRGRAIIAESDSLMKLQDDFKEVWHYRTLGLHITTGLYPSITNAFDYMQEEVCLEIVKWLQLLLKYSYSVKFNKFVRQLLIEAFQSKLSINLSDSLEFEVEVAKKGLLDSGSIPIPFNMNLSKNRNTILDYLMYFNIRCFKKYRCAIKSLIIDNYSKEQQYKILLSDKFAQLFPNLVLLHSVDRERDLNIIQDVYVQILSSPSSSINVMKKNHFPLFVRPLYDLLRQEHSMAAWMRSSIYSSPIISNKTFLFCLQRIIMTVHLIVDKLPIELRYLCLLKQNCSVLIDVLSIFDKLMGEKRKIGEHVDLENESFTLVNHIYDLLLKIMDVCFNDYTFAAKNGATPLIAYSKILDRFQSTTPKLKKVMYGDEAFSVQDYKVSESKNSLFEPFVSLFSMLSTFKNLKNGDVILMVNFDAFNKLADNAVRIISYASQVGGRFWVLNGKFLMHYCLEFLQGREITKYNRCIHVCQLRFSAQEKQQFLINILNRWELLDWLSSSTNDFASGYESTVFKDKIPFIGFRLVLFFYHILTERRYITPSEKSEDNITTYNKILYKLAAGPASFKELSDWEYEANFIGTQHNNGIYINEVLNEIAIYRKPTGDSDKGIFKLKDEYYKFIDPLSVYAQSLPELHDIVKQKLLEIVKKKQMNEELTVDDIFIEPKILAVLDPIKGYSDFVYLQLFIDLMVKLIKTYQVVEEHYGLNITLTLLFAITIDATQNKCQLPLSYLPVAISIYESYISDKTDKQNKTLIAVLLKRIFVLNLDIKSALVDEFSEEAISALVIEKNDESENKNKRRKLIESKKRAAFEKLAKQRELFQKNHISEDATTKNVEEEEQHQDSRRCIVCQKSKASENFLVTIGSTAIHRVFAKSVHTNKEFRAMYEPFHTDVVLEDLIESNNRFVFERELPKLPEKEIINSCNHPIHLECIKRVSALPKVYYCPLCNYFGDCLIPTVKFGTVNLDLLEDLFSEESGAKKQLEYIARYNNLFDTSPRREVKDIIFNTLIHEDVGDSYRAPLDKLLGEGTVFKKIMNRAGVITLLANSIDALEIAGRFQVNKDSNPYSDFLKDIPEIKIKFLRNYLQFLVMHENISRGIYVQQTKNDSTTSTAKLIAGFLQKEIPFKELIKCMYMNEIFTIILATRKLFDNALKSLDGLPFSTKIRNMKKLKNSICEKFEVSATSLTDLFVKGLLIVIERNCIKMFRRVIILLKVLCFDPESGKAHHEVDNFLNGGLLTPLEDSFFDENPTDFQPYLSFFGLEDIFDIITGDLLNDKTFICEENQMVDDPSVFSLIPLPRNFDSIKINFTNYQDLVNKMGYKFSRFSTLWQNSIVGREGRPKNIDKRYDVYICLFCGEKINFCKEHGFSIDRNKKNHMFGSKGVHCIFLNAVDNTISLLVNRPDLESGAETVRVTSPYLNEFGESGLTSLAQMSFIKLDERRYKLLIKNYLRDGFNNKVKRQTRLLRIPRNIIEAGGFNFAFGDDIDDMADDDDDDDDDEEDDDDADDITNNDDFVEGYDLDEDDIDESPFDTNLTINDLWRDDLL